MQTTTNYNLNKPESTDNVLVEKLNENMDIIDAKLKSLETEGVIVEPGVKKYAFTAPCKIYDDEFHNNTPLRTENEQFTVTIKGDQIVAAAPFITLRYSSTTTEMATQPTFRDMYYSGALSACTDISGSNTGYSPLTELIASLKSSKILGGSIRTEMFEDKSFEDDAIDINAIGTFSINTITDEEPQLFFEFKGVIPQGYGLLNTSAMMSGFLESGGTGLSLPTASASTLGGVKVGSNLSIDSNGVLSATGGSVSYAKIEILDVTQLSETSDIPGSATNISSGSLTIVRSGDVVSVYADISINSTTGNGYVQVSLPEAKVKEFLGITTLDNHMTLLAYNWIPSVSSSQTVSPFTIEAYGALAVQMVVGYEGEGTEPIAALMVDVTASSGGESDYSNHSMSVTAVINKEE